MSLALAAALVAGIGLGAASIPPQSGWQPASPRADAALAHDARLSRTVYSPG